METSLDILNKKMIGNLSDVLDKEVEYLKEQLTYGDPIKYEGKEYILDTIIGDKAYTITGESFDAAFIDFVRLTEEYLRGLFQSNTKPLCGKIIDTDELFIRIEYDLNTRFLRITRISKNEIEDYEFSGKVYYKHALKRAFDLCRIPKELIKI